MNSKICDVNSERQNIKSIQELIKITDKLQAVSGFYQDSSLWISTSFKLVNLNKFQICQNSL